ncbi:DUF6118 family protein [Polymorphum gilvum]|uniref:Uncharacterized protein n=1 Tax=Polymorphum gilvum (strain LMG 25793 / CGMCC 1.9160 / SL003B-26A1) TaxID=991905 RepID=F2J730_POLGS|nr:hypothetical protein SL003B_p0071 [Polymorphum gilvum SL003B-26A1]
MTDDDKKEGFDPEVSPADAGDPAAAFEALRETVEDLAADLSREMTTIRKGVEAAFEEFEKFQKPTDYGPDLGRIVQQLAQVGERLQGVEQSPILRNGPQHYAARLERSGEGLIRTAAQQLERQASDLERTANNLARHISGARERRHQNQLLWGAGAAGLVAGVLLTLFLPRVLPGSVDMAVAATVMNADHSLERWNLSDAVRKPWRLARRGRCQQPCTRQPGGAYRVRRDGRQGEEGSALHDQRCSAGKYPLIFENDCRK